VNECSVSPYGKVLKNQDPLVLSIGWRRFQSIPVYSMQVGPGALNPKP
jgi:hypothetical protein